MTTEKTSLLSSGDVIQPNNDIQNCQSAVEGTAASDSSESSKRWTKRQILIAMVLSLMTLCQNISFSIITPFYPHEASVKGASSTEIGLVFGVFELLVFITSPIYGSLIPKMGAKFLFICGAFILGGTSISFGSVEANGAAMMGTASFAIMATTFSKDVGRAIGILEVCSGAGMVLGPSVGGGLYAAGGFTLPFLVIGGLVWGSTILSFFILPSFDNVSHTHGNFFSVLKIPGCIILYLIVVSCGISLSFLDPTFSIWMLATFPWITIPQVGFIFMTGPGVYAISAPLSGYLTDKGYQGVLAVGGSLATSIAFFLLGPNPLIATFIPTTLPLVIISLVILGMAIGATVIPVFSLTIRFLRNKGFGDNIQTYGLVSGLIMSGFSLGGFLGPTAAGYFAGKFGFAWSTTCCASINIAVGLIMLIYILVLRHQGMWPMPIPNEENNQQTESSANASVSDYGSVSA